MDEVGEVDEVDEVDEEDEVDEVDKVDKVDEVGPPASRGQSPGSAGDSVVLNVPRRTETAQENGISADFCIAACKIFSCEYIRIITYSFTDVLWEYC